MFYNQPAKFQLLNRLSEPERLKQRTSAAFERPLDGFTLMRLERRIYFAVLNLKAAVRRYAYL